MQIMWLTWCMRVNHGAVFFVPGMILGLQNKKLGFELPMCTKAVELVQSGGTVSTWLNVIPRFHRGSIMHLSPFNGSKTLIW